MGQSSSKIRVSEGSRSEQLSMQTRAWFLRMRTDQAKLLTSVHHFTPCIFPISPVVTQRDVEIVKMSWTSIQTGTAEGLRENSSSGLVVLFDLFYSHLFSRSKVFQAHFGSNLKLRGEILVRIIQFITSLDLANERVVKTKLYYLGRSHVGKGIKPWQYGMFVETLLESVMHTLGADGTCQVAKSWTQVIAFILTHMLPEAIRTTVNPADHTTNFKVDASGQEQMQTLKLAAKSTSRSASKPLVTPSQKRAALQDSGFNSSTGNLGSTGNLHKTKSPSGSFALRARKAVAAADLLPKKDENLTPEKENNSFSTIDTQSLHISPDESSMRTHDAAGIRTRKPSNSRLEPVISDSSANIEADPNSSLHLVSYRQEISSARSVGTHGSKESPAPLPPIVSTTGSPSALFNKDTRVDGTLVRQSFKGSSPLFREGSKKDLDSIPGITSVQ